MAIQNVSLGAYGPFQYDDVTHQALSTTGQLRVDLAPSQAYHVLRKDDHAIAGSMNVGLDANKSASPTVGDIYLATDTDILYKCIAAGVWSRIRNLDLGGNDVADLADVASAGADIDDAVTRRHDEVHTVVSHSDVSEGTFTITGTGFAVNPTGTARYVKVGNLVVLYIPNLQGTSNAATFMLTGIPAAIQAARDAFIHAAKVMDNGVGLTSPGLIRINVGATAWDVYSHMDNGAWTASGTKRLYQCMVCYTLV